MLCLDDDDLLLDVAPPPATASPLLAQTPSLGLKQSVVRWLPAAADRQRARCLAGSWDDPQSNELSVWSVSLDLPVDDSMADAGDAAAPPPRAASVGTTTHAGCVLGLSVGATPTAGGKLVAFTASGAGGASCYTIDLGAADDGAGIDGTGAISLREQWAGAGLAPNGGGGIATLGVAYSEGAGAVCAVGEDGVLSLLNPESGACAWRAPTREAALFDVSWCAGLGSHCVVAAGTTLGVWDVRAKAGAPQLSLAPAPGAQAHLAASLLCVAADPQPPYRLAAGASDGALHVWDVRASAAAATTGAGGSSASSRVPLSPQCSLAGAHAGDVWGVQIGNGQWGQLLSCAADGTLVAWSSLELSGGRNQEAASRRTLVELSLPINSLDLSTEHGLLASASDAQVLTFLDLRVADALA